jgi:enoyl-CoA hydratase
VITLNRPEVHNALSMSLSASLIDALAHVRETCSVWILVLRGAPPSFSAGDDIKEMLQWVDPNEVMRRVRLYQQMASELEELDKIIVAAVDGYAVGGKLEITMACDFVVATDRAAGECRRSIPPSRPDGARRRACLD